MNKLFLSLSVLLCLAHGQSIAQKPGDIRWDLSVDLSHGHDSIHSIKVQLDGKIVAAGNSYRGSYMAIALGRFESGRRDSTFGINGIVTTSLDLAHTVANSVELLPDGKIVVAGGYTQGLGSDFLLARYNPDGSTDSSFGNNGIVQTGITPGSFDIATASALQPDGKILAAGWVGSSLALCRYFSDGSLDTGFDSDGKLTIATGGATCMKLQTDGKIVIGAGLAVVRLMPDGSLDSSFGVDGIAPLVHACIGMAIQPDGKILVSGDKSEFVLQRLDTAGAMDNSFGNGGIVKTAGFAATNYRRGANSVLLQADGRILACGWAQHTQQVQKNFTVVKYQTNGAPDSSFGTYGKVSNVSVNIWVAHSLTAAIDNNNELVLAGTTETGSTVNWALAGYYLGPPLAVTNIPSVNSKIIVSPNPAEDFARIQSKQIANGPWQLYVCDLTGRTLYRETVVVMNNTLDKSISLIGLPPAMYLVGLDNGMSRMATMLTKSR